MRITRDGLTVNHVGQIGKVGLGQIDLLGTCRPNYNFRAPHSEFGCSGANDVTVTRMG